MTDLTALDKSFIRKLKGFARNGYAFDSEHKLREGTQYEAFDAFTTGFSEGHRHGYCEIPTGVGKTAFFISLIKNYLDAINGSPEAPRVLIAVPSVDLVKQTARAFAKFMPELGNAIEADDDTGTPIDVGLQYHKTKHAHLKPKVLITTYQSIAKDEQNKTYSPNDYGLVIYDEGHATTAPKFGKAVDKFKDAIQLAVTATPEYSEEKTVAQKLPHRYFHLPLSEAINRGDLCQVHPVLVRTNYTVDRAQFERFLSRQPGKNLTKPQIEKLLNQEVRNLSAIKTYLLGEDPDSKERYFGQTGMVFAGGIDHCNDIVDQFHRVLGQRNYKPLREWLKEEGVALIAPIHSNVPKEGVELTIDGVKRKYTKDEIKDLHRKGKILLVVSDKELKEGTDFPRDSIVLEMVDRTSVVDTTQRFGRGFRTNPPDAEFNDLGNPDKICTAINLVDNNTYDLYKDTPQMLPVYCSEILGGAEFRVPASRKHLLTRFKRDVPNIDDSLEQSGFEVITDIERVKAVSAEYVKEKIAKKKTPLDLPEKPDDVWSAQQLSERIGTSKAIGQGIVGKIRELLEDNTASEHIEYLDINIPRNALAAYKYKESPAFGLKAEWGEKIAVAYVAYKEKHPPKPNDVWSGTQLSEKLGTSTSGHKIIRGLKEQLIDGGASSADYRGVSIPKSALVQYDYNGDLTYGIKVEYGEKIVAIHKIIPAKPDDVWSSRDLSAKLDVVGSGDHIISKLVAQLEDESVDYAEYRGVKVPRSAIVDYEYNRLAAKGIKSEWGEKIVAVHGARKEKPDGVWSGSEIAEKLGITELSGYNIVIRLRTQLLDTTKTHGEYKGIQIPRDAIVEYDNAGTSAYGLKAQWGEKIVAAAKKMQGKPEGVWSGPELSEKLGTSTGQYILKTLKQQLDEDPQRQTAQIKDVVIPRDAIVEYFYRDKPATGIKAEWGQKIVEGYTPRQSVDNGAQEGREPLKAKKATPRTSPAHQSTEERAEAKSKKRDRE